MVQQQTAEAKARAEAQEGDQMSTASTEDGPRDRDVEAEIREAAGKAALQTAQQGNGGLPGRNESVVSNASIKGASDKQSKKSSFLGGFVNKKPSMSSRGGERPEIASATSAGTEAEDPRINNRNSMVVDPAAMAVPPNANKGRIRFAAFLAVEVRGKGPTANAPAGGANSGKEAGSAAGGATPQPSVNVLFKAPVYEF